MSNEVLNIYNEDNYYSIKKINPLLLNHLKKVEHKNALEIGCGAGENAKFINKMGYKVLAIDINENVIKTTQKKHLNFVCGDIRNFNWKEKYDLITAFYVYQHLSQLDTEKILQKCITNLNNCGILIIAIFEERKNAIDGKQLLHILEKYENMKQILQKRWTRKDCDHGKKHIHKGFYCIYEKIKNKKLC